MRSTRSAAAPKPAVPTTRGAKAAASSSTMGHGPVSSTKSMRQLNKENEELQQQVKEMSEVLKASSDAKATAKAASERAVKRKDEEIAALRATLENLELQVEEERLLKEQEALRATEAEEAGAQEKDEMAYKLHSTGKSLDECQRRLEAAGINAVSLKEWVSREQDQDEDVAMLENQLKDAMDLLKGHKAGLREQISSTEQVRKAIGEMAASLDDVAKEPEEEKLDEEEEDEDNQDNDQSLESINEEDETEEGVEGGELEQQQDVGVLAADDDEGRALMEQEDEEGFNEFNGVIEDEPLSPEAVHQRPAAFEKGPVESEESAEEEGEDMAALEQHSEAKPDDAEQAVEGHAAAAHAQAESSGAEHASAAVEEVPRVQGQQEAVPCEAPNQREDEASVVEAAAEESVEGAGGACAGDGGSDEDMDVEEEEEDGPQARLAASMAALEAVATKADSIVQDARASANEWKACESSAVRAAVIEVLAGAVAAAVARIPAAPASVETAISIDNLCGAASPEIIIVPCTQTPPAPAAETIEVPAANTPPKTVVVPSAQTPPAPAAETIEVPAAVRPPGTVVVPSAQTPTAPEAETVEVPAAVTPPETVIVPSAKTPPAPEAETVEVPAAVTPPETVVVPPAKTPPPAEDAMSMNNLCSQVPAPACAAPEPAPSPLLVSKEEVVAACAEIVAGAMESSIAEAAATPEGEASGSIVRSLAFSP